MSFLPVDGCKVAGLGVLMAIALLVGCAGSESEDALARAPDSGLRACLDPRPEVCTKQYRPVCGHRCAAPPCTEADRRSYGNGCDACADASVRAHRPGRCDGAPPADPPMLR